jgi:hypothetical protein
VGVAGFDDVGAGQRLHSSSKSGKFGTSVVDKAVAVLGAARQRLNNQAARNIPRIRTSHGKKGHHPRGIVLGSTRTSLPYNPT